MRASAVIGKFFKYFILILFALVFLYPVYLSLMTSLKTINDIGNNPLGFPQSLQFINYSIAVTKAKLLRAFLNSFVITVAGVACTVFFNSMTAYVLARFTFKFNKLIYVYILAGMMIPGILYLTPRFLLMKDLHLLGNILVLILPCIANPFAIFLYVGFLRALPKEVEEAAVIDGCGSYKLFFRILFPLVKPITVTIVVLTSIGLWNDFFSPLIYLPGTQVNTVMLACFNFLHSYAANWNYFFAALILSIAPVLILYIILQKQVIKGIAEGAVKG